MAGGNRPTFGFLVTLTASPAGRFMPFQVIVGLRERRQHLPQVPFCYPIRIPPSQERSSACRQVERCLSRTETAIAASARTAALLQSTHRMGPPPSGIDGDSVMKIFSICILVLGVLRVAAAGATYSVVARYHRFGRSPGQQCELSADRQLRLDQRHCVNCRRRRV